MNTKEYRPSRIRALSKARQAMLKRMWDARLRDPLAFVPRKEKARGLSATDARKENMRLGKFAASYLKSVIRRLTDDLERRRRLDSPEIVIAIGYGYGYDSKWLRQATEAGFQTWWVDVSSRPWIWATQNLQAQYDAICRRHPVPYPEPQVRTFEIQSLLADPMQAELDVGNIGIWYLCRLLNCLSTRSAKAVLQEIGRTALGSGPDPHKRKAIVVINALCDDNIADPCGGTSTVRSKKMILANIGYGAMRPVEARFMQHYLYFGKRVTAMTIMAK